MMRRLCLPQARSMRMEQFHKHERRNIRAGATPAPFLHRERCYAFRAGAGTIFATTRAASTVPITTSIPSPAMNAIGK